MGYLYNQQYMPVQYAAPMPAPAGQLEQLRAAQQYQAAQQQAQNAQSGIIWVQGEEGAKAYMVAPGASVLLMDSESQAFYIKSVDQSGMPMPLRIFDYSERQIQQPQTTPIMQNMANADGPQFVTIEEFEELKRQIDDLRKTAPAVKKKEAQDDGK